MPQSIFAANATQFVDQVSPTYAPAQYWNLGAQYIGGSKGFVRRCLGGFDVFGAAASGRALTLTDTLTAAELMLETLTVIGPTGWGAKLERLSRADWDYTVADWTRTRSAPTGRRLVVMSVRFPPTSPSSHRQSPARRSSPACCPTSPTRSPTVAAKCCCG